MSAQKPLEVIAGQSDRPLIIGEIEIPCYVLEDETRVITQTGFLEGTGTIWYTQKVQVQSNSPKCPLFYVLLILNPL